MNIIKLKEANQVAIAVEGRYEVLKIQKAMSKEKVTSSELDIAKQLRDRYTKEIDENEDLFNLSYKVVRDSVFKDMKSKNMQVAGFVRRIGEDSHSAYYAAGLYDIAKAKSKGLNDLETAKNGNGVIIAIVVEPLDTQNCIIESQVYDEVINVFNNKDKYGVKPMAIKSYKNFTEDCNFEYDELLWGMVEANMEKQKEEEIENNVEVEEKKYVQTLYAIKPPYIQPYNKIGHYNESIEGKDL